MLIDIISLETFVPTNLDILYGPLKIHENVDSVSSSI